MNLKNLALEDLKRKHQSAADKLEAAHADIKRFEELCQELRHHDIPFNERVCTDLDGRVTYTIEMSGTEDSLPVGEMLITLSAMGCDEARQPVHCAGKSYNASNYFLKCDQTPDFTLHIFRLKQHQQQAEEVAA